MTSHAAPTKLDYGKIAAALAALRALLIAGNVIIRDLWHDAGSGPGAVTGRVVEITVEGQPAELDAILTGLVDRSEPNRWYGNHYSFIEWHGLLMTMPVLLIERIRIERPSDPGRVEGRVAEPVDQGAGYPVAFPPLPAGARAACADHPDFVPTSLHHLKDHIEALHLDDPCAGCAGPGPCPQHGEVAWDNTQSPDGDPAAMDSCSCWSTGRAGCPVHRITDAELPDPTLVRPYITQTDTRPLLDLERVLDERFGTARGPVAPIEVISGPHVTPDQLVEQFAAAQGVPVIPGRKFSPEQLKRIESAHSEYARARAMHYFSGHRFPSMIAARKAIAYWPGAGMLDPENFEIVAGALVDPPRTPEPGYAPAEPPRSRRLFALRTRKEA